MVKDQSTQKSVIDEVGEEVNKRLDCLEQRIDRWVVYKRQEINTIQEVNKRLDCLDSE